MRTPSCGRQCDKRGIATCQNLQLNIQQHVQGDPSGRGLYCVDFDLGVPISALFCLGSCKSGKIGMPCSNMVKLPNQSQQNIVVDLMGHPEQTGQKNEKWSQFVCQTVVRLWFSDFGHPFKNRDTDVLGSFFLSSAPSEESRFGHSRSVRWKDGPRDMSKD